MEVVVLVSFDYFVVELRLFCYFVCNFSLDIFHWVRLILQLYLSLNNLRKITIFCVFFILTKKSGDLHTLLIDGCVVHVVHCIMH